MSMTREHLSGRERRRERKRAVGTNEEIKEGRNERRNQSGEKKGRNERAGRKEGTKRSTGMKRKVHGIKQTKKFICLVKRVRKE